MVFQPNRGRTSPGPQGEVRPDPPISQRGPKGPAPLKGKAKGRKSKGSRGKRR